MYFYKSPVGTFQIARRSDGFHLILNGEVLGVYRSAIAAADDVFLHVTGATQWDCLDSQVSDAPSGLQDWEIE